MALLAVMPRNGRGIFTKSRAVVASYFAASAIARGLSSPRDDNLILVLCCAIHGIFYTFQRGEDARSLLYPIPKSVKYRERYRRKRAAAAAERTGRDTKYRYNLRHSGGYDIRNYSIEDEDRLVV